MSNTEKPNTEKSNTEYLTATMTVDRTPEEVFAAVTDVRGWWNQNIIGNTAAVGDEFVFTDDVEYAGETAKTNKDGIRFSRFRISEVVPGERVVWHVVDSDLSFVADREEWTGTDVVFDITADRTGTTLHFTHEGLSAADSECFEECSRGWTFYITRSLPQLITTGTGLPFAKYNA
ncbi:SRPBCC domain-containing protein [Nocardia cyriacigeorgica]|uniref:SRPBCC family protein n=1 Tax=Nocardia cyriacigeorgica TaxID=135487 RepID=UPI001895B41C|nr:SRPBCC domain-containing protein [Nocardia cyriacigeorgica]MBF6159716.1 SRPBCC domain-containing protein [Nocardia cyriacigeorgica]MBF6198799.1 SRPBCC domain-containing protein [Nocardia cyriacigeorgica]MBF6316059.1 SRPBCC domain-containing protein [Nocardia cyriacigeorgica]MBF6530844.1 SRPBCC domain-containing protein [Nocardia cyriacigeorgica]